MAQPTTLNDLAVQLTAEIIRNFKKHDLVVPRDQINEIVSEVRHALESKEDGVAAIEHQLRQELSNLSNYIQQVKQDIASIRPKDISSDHIPLVTDELDAVVGATEEATNKIMDVCDEITALAGQTSQELNEKLTNCTTRIFEACNFQDITGQRISKVVNALKNIDSKVEALIGALGEDFKASVADGEPANDRGDSLLNGPQLPGQGMDQANIDKLLAED